MKQGISEIVIASRNPKKLAELQDLLAPLGYTAQLVSTFSDVEVAETAPTFVENALLKARHAARVSGLPAIADDSGLEVDALNGAPGVYSARYAGEPSDDLANNTKLLIALQDVPPEKRTARFVSVLVWLRHADDPTPKIAFGEWGGSIIELARGSAGFGYDPLFQDAETGLTAAELTASEKHLRSHRGKAMAALLAQLRG